MRSTNNPLIVALDVETLDEAKQLVETLGERVQIYKVGSQLFTACGPEVIYYLEKKGKKVFLDLKYHDIPNTVAKAVESAACLSEAIVMLTVHTQGGKEMLEAAANASKQKAKLIQRQPIGIIGVTVLTSETKVDSMDAIVLQRALLAKQSGLDGVVASPQEARIIRKELGKDFLIVTPGIRPNNSSFDDQKRIATPKEAIQSGSNFLVVGRPIVKAENPIQATDDILKEIEKVK